MATRRTWRRACNGLPSCSRPAGGDVEAVQRLSGGASQQTWAFDIRGGAGSVPLILRRAADGAGERAKMTAGLEVEAHLIAAAKAAGVPVPGIRHVLRPEDGLGQRLRDGALARRDARAVASCAMPASQRRAACWRASAVKRWRASTRCPPPSCQPLRLGGPAPSCKAPDGSAPQPSAPRARCSSWHSSGCAEHWPGRRAEAGARARRLSQRQPDGGRGRPGGRARLGAGAPGRPDGRSGLAVRQRVALRLRIDLPVGGFGTRDRPVRRVRRRRRTSRMRNACTTGR